MSDRPLTLGFMQPYFLPYPGYFELIARSDVWLVFDDAQMIRRGWVNRNRILHPTKSWQYVRVPVAKHAREAPIGEVRIADPNWAERLVAQLAHYREAPYYGELIPLIQGVGASRHERLIDVNLALQRAICERLDLSFAPRLHSELGLDRSLIQEPGDWAYEAAKALGAMRYINPAGGRELFDPARFSAAGIELSILESSTGPYDQGGRPFEPGLSILDLLMFLSPEEARRRIAPGSRAEIPSDSGERAA